jgi:3',5'-cyclic AMP phosphodiesterase CpdA
MFRLAHLSDPHLGPLPPVRLRDLASKRILGYANWHLHRSRRVLQAGQLQAIVDDLTSSSPDHIAVTGDLVNLALADEFPLATRWLATLGAPDAVSVVPGNHDAYVPGASAQATRAWNDHMRGDGESLASFPFVRRRGAIAIIGVSTARATLPFMATGHLDQSQCDALAQALQSAAGEGLCRVVLIHHPPVPGLTPHYKRLVEMDAILSVIDRNGADLILHGHTHKASTHWIAGPDRPVPVVGVQAASLQTTPEKRGACWNLIEIDGTPDAWEIDLTERGFAAGSGEIATLSRSRLRYPG